MMKLIFMGTPAFALPALQALIDSDHEVVAVYSQPPRPAGRGQKLRPSAVQTLAEQHGIDVYTPTSLKSEEVQAKFAAHGADAAIVAAYGLILPPAILAACPQGCINIHPSKLPRWRGAAPLQRTIMAGDTETAIVIMQMDAGLDTGDRLAIKDYAITEGMTSGELHDWLAGEAAPLLLDALKQLEQGGITPTPQSKKGVTYADKINKEEAAIDWSKSATDIAHHIHGLSPFPGATTMLAGEPIKIYRVAIGHPEAFTEASEGNVIQPGTTLDDQLTIACGQGTLKILQLQRPGSKRLLKDDFLRGHPIGAGTKLSAIDTVC